MDGTRSKQSSMAANLPFGHTEDCPEIDEICMYLEGTAQEELLNRLENHFADCPSCRKAVFEMRKTISDAESVTIDSPCTEKAKELVEEQSIQSHSRENKAMA